MLVQRSFAGRIARHVPPQAFHPPPKVDSSVVVLTRKAVDSEGPDDASFEKSRQSSLFRPAENPAQHFE